MYIRVGERTVISFISAAAKGSVSRACIGSLVLEFRVGVCGKPALFLFAHSETFTSLENGRRSRDRSEISLGVGLRIRKAINWGFKGTLQIMILDEGE